MQLIGRGRGEGNVIINRYVLSLGTSRDRLMKFRLVNGFSLGADFLK